MGVRELLNFNSDIFRVLQYLVKSLGFSFRRLSTILFLCQVKFVQGGLRTVFTSLKNELMVVVLKFKIIIITNIIFLLISDGFIRI